MRITVDPMPHLRERARWRVDAQFNAQAMPHRDAARAAKRAAAKRVLAGESEASLDEEAALRAVTALELAALILSKPDELQEREIKRQRLLKAIADAATPAGLDAALVGLSEA
jgi:hypothetical protein